MSAETTTHGDCLGTCMGVVIPEGASVRANVHCRTEEQFDQLAAQLVELYSSVKARRGPAVSRPESTTRWVEAEHGDHRTMTVFWPGEHTPAGAQSFDETIDAKLAGLKFIEVPSAVSA